MTENTPLIALPPGYIVLSREDYDMLMARMNNINSNAYEDVKRLNDDIAYLHKILEEKQDEIVRLQETVDDIKAEKRNMFDRINLELKYNGELEKVLAQYKEYLEKFELVGLFENWKSNRNLWDAALKIEETLDASLEELREPGP